MKKLTGLTVLVLLVLAVFAGCSADKTFHEEVVFNQGFFRPSERALPDEIARWVEYSKKIEAVQEKEYDGYRYVLITEGMKPTGGFEIQVEEVVVSDDVLEVIVRTQKPQEGDKVKKGTTYPYDLIIVENKEHLLWFVDVDDPYRMFMEIYGIDEIDRPIVASSDWIKIFGPEPNEEVQGTINLSGLASVFEGSVDYELISDTGSVITTGYTTGAFLAWGYFEEQIQIPQGVTGNVTLELYSESMEDGSKMFVVEIPLIVKTN